MEDKPRIMSWVFHIQGHIEMIPRFCLQAPTIVSKTERESQRQRNREGETERERGGGGLGFRVTINCMGGF